MKKIRSFAKYIWNDPVWNKVLAVIICNGSSAVWPFVVAQTTKLTFAQAFRAFWSFKLPIYYILIAVTALCILSIVRYYQRKKRAEMQAKEAMKTPLNVYSTIKIQKNKVGNHDMDSLIEALKTQIFRLGKTGQNYNAFEIFLNWYPHLLTGIPDQLYDERTELLIRCARVWEAYGLIKRKVWGAGTSIDLLLLTPIGIEFYTKLQQQYQKSSPK